MADCGSRPTLDHPTTSVGRREAPYTWPITVPVNSLNTRIG